MSVLLKTAALLIGIAMPTVGVADSGIIKFLEPVKVAGTTLPSGDYVVEWDAQGAAVGVTFCRDNHKVLTVPAALRAIRHRYNAVTVRPEAEGIASLLEIDFRDLELRFQLDDTNPNTLNDSNRK